MSEWNFEPLTYQVGWRSFGVDRPHYPFQYRPSTVEMVDYERECAAAAEQFASRLDDDLYWAFVTMLDPQVRVYACGFTGPNDAEKVRVYAALRGDYAVVVSQDAGPDQECGGTVHVSRIAASRCGGGVVRALPCVGAGSHPRIDVDRSDLEADPGEGSDESASWLHAPVRVATPKKDFERLLARPRVGTGRLEVYPGATVGERDTGGGREVRWIDVADDGRYVCVDRRRTVSLMPGNADTFATLVQERITVAAEERSSELRP